MRAVGGIGVHRLLHVALCLQPQFPLRMEVIDGLVLHPGGETLVEPQIIPPRHGDEITEPLVCHLVRDDHGDVLPITFGREARIDQ